MLLKNSSIISSLFLTKQVNKAGNFVTSFEIQKKRSEK